MKMPKGGKFRMPELYRKKPRQMSSHGNISLRLSPINGGVASWRRGMKRQNGHMISTLMVLLFDRSPSHPASVVNAGRQVVMLITFDGHITGVMAIMNKVGVSFGMIVLGAGLAMGSAAQAGDAVKGEKVFKKCKACHYVDKAKNKTGPHLVDILDRAAGSIEGYKYSKAMANSGLIWDEATLTAYLKAPKKFVKGTKMAFAGLKKDADIANVIAYLRAAK